MNTDRSDYMSIVGSPNYRLPVIGSVEVSNNISVQITTDDYISIVGSPSYSLPIIGSVQVSSIVGAVDVNTTTADYISIVGSPNYNLPIIGSVQVSSINSALPAGTAILGSVKIEDGGNTITVDGTVTANLAAGTNLIGSVVADIVGLSTSDYISIVGSPNYSLPVIGSVEISSMRNPWLGIGSIVDTEIVRDGSTLSFSWVGALTGSVMGIPPTGSRFNVTDVVCSASGQGIVTLFFNADNLANRVAKGFLANFGGFSTNYSKPIRGPVNGSLMITTAAAGFTPVGDVTVGFTMSA